MERPLSFRLDRFAAYETTITAELRGQVTYVPAQEYTGVPLGIILAEASPLEGAEKITVMATDGYMVEFPLEAVLNDDQMLLIREGDSLRLIAANYEGGYWVRMVNRIMVE